MEFQIIAEKIIKLKDADLELRNQLIRSGNLGNRYNKEMADLHNRNAKKLNKIIKLIGYPTKAAYSGPIDPPIPIWSDPPVPVSLTP